LKWTLDIFHDYEVNLDESFVCTSLAWKPSSVVWMKVMTVESFLWMVAVVVAVWDGDTADTPGTIAVNPIKWSNSCLWIGWTVADSSNSFMLIKNSMSPEVSVCHWIWPVHAEDWWNKVVNVDMEDNP
jgi:hypothetical protein